MSDAAAKKPRPTTLAIRIFQVLLLGLGIGWAFTLSGQHLDQMQVPGFLISLAISWWLTPEIRARAMKLGLVDKTADEGGEARKIHKKAVPRLGGVAIYISIVVTLVATMAIGGRFPKEGGFAGIAAGGTLIFVLGLMDDLDGVPARNKLVVQILAAMAAYSLGVRIEKNLPLPLNVHLPGLIIPGGIRLGQFALPITVAWLVGITNAVNLIDGMDGLAAGVSAIAAVTIWAVAMASTATHTHPAPYPALTAAILSGALLGFLRWNFNPARIFLGDSGAYLAGFVLGCIAITGVMKVTTVVTVGLPLVILLFPLVDTSWAVIRRLAKRKSIFSPDDKHIHHRLLQTGMSQKSVAYVIYAISGVLGLIATAMVGQAALILYVQIMVCVLVMALFFAEVLNRNRQRQGSLPPPDEPIEAETPVDVASGTPPAAT